MSQKLDRFGAVASSLCAAHCAVCALLPAAFSALGLGFLIGHEAEWVFTLVAVALGFGALILGWKQHGSFRVAGLLAVGIVGLLASRGLEMGSEHHGHHGDDHHAEVGEKSPHADEDEKHSEEEEGEHADEHKESKLMQAGVSHVAGATVGIVAGLLLLFGHILNIRTMRKCPNPCCP